VTPQLAGEPAPTPTLVATPTTPGALEPGVDLTVQGQRQKRGYSFVLEVLSVRRHSRFDKAGLRVGDLIYAWNPMRGDQYSMKAFQEQVIESAEQVQLELARGNESLQLLVPAK
jgi:hypothetical protein